MSFFSHFFVRLFVCLFFLTASSFLKHQHQYSRLRPSFVWREKTSGVLSSEYLSSPRSTCHVLGVLFTSSEYLSRPRSTCQVLGVLVTSSEYLSSPRSTLSILFACVSLLVFYRLYIHMYNMYICIIHMHIKTYLYIIYV